MKAAEPDMLRLRGRITAVSATAMTLTSVSGEGTLVRLDDATRCYVAEAQGLAAIHPRLHIAVAAKPLGPANIAVTVLIEPTAVIGPGSRPWDPLPDTTLPKIPPITPLTIVSGLVGQAAPALTPTRMISGVIVSAVSQGYGMQVHVMDGPSEQAIQVPPTASVLRLVPTTVANLATGDNAIEYEALAILSGGGRPTASVVIVSRRGDVLF